MRVKLLFICCFLNFAVLAQQDVNFYSESFYRAKSLFQAGEYDLAAAVFKECAVTSPRNVYEEYANYYMALSAYRSGLQELASIRFRQTLERFPNWEKKDELLYWLARIAYEQGQTSEALKYESKIINQLLYADLDARRQNVLDKEDDISQVKKWYEQYPSDHLAMVLARLIVKEEIEDRDDEFLSVIIEKHDLSRADLGLADASTSITKNEYHVGVFFPFLYDTANYQLTSNFVTDLYQGIKMAVEDLNQVGPRIYLHSFDTKADSAHTVTITGQNNISALDMIIGPLYSRPRKVISSISQRERINMINPLSDNFEIIGSNPFSFLFHPSTLTKAKAAAEFSTSVFDRDEVIIFHENDRKNQLAALVYQGLVEEKGFNVVEVIGKDKAAFSDILKYLTKTHYDEDGYETDSLVIQPDSIGHIFVSAGNVQLGANVLSAVAKRGDKIPLIGDSDWLDYNFFNPDQLSNERVYLLSTNFMGTSPEKREFQERLVEIAANTPSTVLLKGYSCMYFFGTQLKTFGTHFQSLWTEESFSAPFISSLDYSESNDNRSVPILKVSDLDVMEIDFEAEKQLFISDTLNVDSNGEE
jgi:tetratricopeptide (TPR) repeat protein